MTIWKPDRKEIAREGRPLYLAIADSIAHAIHLGELAPGSRLPTHRELAGQLGCTVGTVTRAYLEVVRRGLVTGEVGRGTFVRAGRKSATPRVVPEGPVNLRDNLPPLPAAEDPDAIFAHTLRAWAATPHAATRFGPEAGGESPSHQQAGASWLERCRVPANPEQILLTNGAQHGLMAVLAAITIPGDIVATERITSPRIKAVASLLHLQLKGLPTDAEGLLPDAFAKVCRSLPVKALYCQPTVQNPTTATLSLERRRELIRVAAEYGVPIVEDDAYGPLPVPRPKPISAMMPPLTYYVASLSKCLGAGLRLAYVLTPKGMEQRVRNAMQAISGMVSPLVAEIAANWMADGTADRIIRGRRAEAEARQQMAAAVLNGFALRAHPQGFHLWLPLPDSWRSELFAAEAAQQGVMVASGEEFVAGPGASARAIRLGLGGAPNRKALQQALDKLVPLLGGRPDPSLA